VDGITISQLADGKIMDSYVSLDLWSMMQQLDALPAMGKPQKSFGEIGSKRPPVSASVLAKKRE
jgi:hypothetical protein